VPPEVKNISPGLALRISATFFLASSTADFEARPKEWVDEGLPNSFFRYGCMDSYTLGSIGVVAALSK
jgi:hypothetical protein